MFVDLPLLMRLGIEIDTAVLVMNIGHVESNIDQAATDSMLITTN